MGWILFFGRDLRDHDRLRRAAASVGLDVRVYSPGAWEALDPPALVVVDLDREGIPAALPEGVKVLGYYSHIDAELARAASAADIEAIPRGKFWSGLPRLLEP